MSAPFLKALGLMTLMAGMTAGGQVLLKLGLDAAGFTLSFRSLFSLMLKPKVLMGLLLALAAPLVYLKALSLLGLSSVYGLNGISYFFVYFLSRFILHEKGSSLHLAGLLLIAGGITVWSI